MGKIHTKSASSDRKPHYIKNATQGRSSDPVYWFKSKVKTPTDRPYPITFTRPSSDVDKERCKVLFVKNKWQGWVSGSYT